MKKLHELLSVYGVTAVAEALSEISREKPAAARLESVARQNGMVVVDEKTLRHPKLGLIVVKKK